MSKHLFWAGSLAALAIATPLEAQRASFQITPYAGYMTSGAIVSGPMGTALRNPGSAVYGGELAVGLTRGLSLVGNVAYSKPRLELGAPLVGGVNVGEVSVLLYDAALRLNVTLPGSLTPFVQGGAGQIRQTIGVGPIETRSTSLAYNVGAGVDVPLVPGLGLQLMAKDYIGKFDAGDATGVDLETETTHNWALSAGLRLGL